MDRWLAAQIPQRTAPKPGAGRGNGAVAGPSGAIRQLSFGIVKAFHPAHKRLHRPRLAAQARSEPRRCRAPVNTARGGDKRRHQAAELRHRKSISSRSQTASSPTRLAAPSPQQSAPVPYASRRSGATATSGAIRQLNFGIVKAYIPLTNGFIAHWFGRPKPASKRAKPYVSRRSGATATSGAIRQLNFGIVKAYIPLTNGLMDRWFGRPNPAANRAKAVRRSRQRRGGASGAIRQLARSGIVKAFHPAHKRLHRPLVWPAQARIKARQCHTPVAAAARRQRAALSGS